VTSEPKSQKVHQVSVWGYPYGLCDKNITVMVDSSIEEHYLKEVKFRVASVADEMRALIRQAKDMAPVLLYVLDGRNTVNKLPRFPEGYGAVFTYNFVPAGMGLLKEPVYGSPNVARSRRVALSSDAEESR
jgi:hypothetical protein